jgi:hypothetical protein
MRRAGIELVEAGYRARVATLEQARADATGARAETPPPEGQGSAMVPETPAPPRRRKSSVRRRPRRTLYDEVVAALDRVPEVFTKDDLAPKLGDPPDRSSLFRILDSLVYEGRLKMVARGSGRLPTRYRRISHAPTA